MVHLLSSVHYSRSMAQRAFSRASQFAHVPLEDIDACLDASQEVVPVDIYSDNDRRPTRTDRVKAVWANDILWGLTETHGLLCSVCLCPCPIGDVDHFRRPVACDTSAWLMVGRDTYGPVAPVHPDCLATYSLLSNLDYADSSGYFQDHLQWRKRKDILEGVRRSITANQRPLRFNPRRAEDLGHYVDMRHNNSYEPSDLESA